MTSAFATTPSWLLAVALFAFFVAVGSACRWIVVKRCTEDRREELAEQAARLLTGLAATFAFFIGISVTITWGAVSAGQAAVEAQASRAQQLSWSLNNIENQQAAKPLVRDLRNYLAAAANEDRPYLSNGNAANRPSGALLDKLQVAVHKYAYLGSTPQSEASGIVSAASALSTADASVTAVADRTLPELIILLLLLTATINTAVMGISAANTRRPILFALWCLIPALSITVVLALDSPFAGDISISLAPLDSLAQHVTINHLSGQTTP